MGRDGSSGSSSGSGSDAGGLDAETARLAKSAPLKAHISQALDKSFPGLPDEATSLLRSLGAGVASSRPLKTSFHKTFLVQLDPPLVHEHKNYASAIVQVIGVELGDKEVFGLELRAATLVRAHELAALAGMRVPAVFATGQCESAVGTMEFIVEEFVATQTVEDEVIAPNKDWRRIRQDDVVAKLKSWPLTDVDTSPLPRYDSCESYIDWLLELVPASDEALSKALSCVREQAVAQADTAGPAVLLHQDINDGNMLCSKAPDGDEWQLDALIDWESAAVVDARCYANTDLWALVGTFAIVVKGAYLAERFVQQTLPRCELEELLEGYQGAARRLEKNSLLPFETWATRVGRCREALRTTAPSDSA